MVKAKKRKNKLFPLLMAVSALLVLIYVFSSEIGISGFADITGMASADSRIPEEQGTLELFFCPKDDCEQVFTARILDSENIICALYDLDLESIRSALGAKHADVLVDEDNFQGFGLEISGSGLMHNKFCVLDNNVVMTGSFNPTFRGAHKNNNNLLVISSRFLSQNFRAQFLDIKDKTKSHTPNPKIMFNGFLVENYFCPEDECEKHVLDILGKAQSSVYFMTFSFTSDPIGDFLISKKDEIEIRGVFEKSQNNQWSEYHKMLDVGMDVLFDANPANMHHKVFIIDGKTVITGSYNPTNNGNMNNDENILIIHDPAVASRFIEEFESVWLGIG